MQENNPKQRSQANAKKKSTTQRLDSMPHELQNGVAKGAVRHVVTSDTSQKKQKSNAYIAAFFVSVAANNNRVIVLHKGYLGRKHLKQEIITKQKIRCKKHK